MPTPKHFNLGILGCGQMGTAILSGIVKKKSDAQSGTSEWEIKHVFVSVKSAASATQLREQFAEHAAFITIFHGDNVAASEGSDVVILGFKHTYMGPILGAPGLRQALEGKTLISVLPGKSTQATLSAVVGEEVLGDGQEHSGITVVRTMPNLAAREGASMTIVAAATSESSQQAVNVTKWVLDHVGKTQEIPEAQFDLIGSLVGCSGAMFTIAIDGLLDASVAGGLKRSEALSMTTQSLLGLVRLLEQGSSPSNIREEVSSPGGSTIKSLMELERHGVRTAFSSALDVAGERAREIGSKEEK
ncbi:unnamed protein product [Clonostachys rosea]|uniref:Pyrroline-5-carboxylate reductase n=1 Tax=Bionectria ochroleuca TaxID=29856 RepID=A0ABY6UMV2_BIOOC|nr:unnamed protein product [Clonostachys rosea]